MPSPIIDYENPCAFFLTNNHPHPYNCITTTTIQPEVTSQVCFAFWKKMHLVFTSSNNLNKMWMLSRHFVLISPNGRRPRLTKLTLILWKLSVIRCYTWFFSNYFIFIQESIPLYPTVQIPDASPDNSVPARRKRLLFTNNNSQGMMW